MNDYALFESARALSDGTRESMPANLAAALAGRRRIVDARETEGWDHRGGLGLVCDSSDRSGFAAREIEAFGFPRAANVADRMSAPNEAKLPIDRG